MKRFTFNIFNGIGEALTEWDVEANTEEEAIQKIKDELCFELIDEEENKEQKEIDAEEEKYYREEYFRYEEQKKDGLIQ